MNKTIVQQCEVKFIDNKIAEGFLIKSNHSSAKNVTGVHSIGLYFKNELVGVVQFGNPTTDFMKKKYMKELLSLGFNDNVNVSEGANRLISYYKKNQVVYDFFAYQDLNKQSNFYKECGMELVSVSDKKDDNVWEWVDTNKVHYTYKITSSDSDKYYFGVSHVKKKEATIEDCLSDGYYGSGDKNENNKFRNWKQKHKKTLNKEIISIFRYRAQALNEEKELVRDKWKTDPLCLNSSVGGLGSSPAKGSRTPITYKECEKHGKTKHRGSACCKCSVEHNHVIEKCGIHGETLHLKNNCLRCDSNKRIRYDFCKIHGETKFKKNTCYKCEQKSIVKQKECKIHGFTSHQGSTCSSCSIEKIVSLKECDIHGLVKFLKNNCYQCLTIEKAKKKECKIHGKTKFIGESCAKCSAVKNYSIKDCHYHGLVSHNGNSCKTCSSEKTAHTRWHKNKKKESCRYCFQQKLDKISID